MFKKYSLALVLGRLFLTGCPKQYAPTSPDQFDPKKEFMSGVKALQKSKNQDNYDKAFNYFQRASEFDGYSSAAYNAGWIKEQQGQLQDAERFYEKAYNANPSREFLFAYTDMLTTNGQAEKSIALMSEYIEKNPSDKDVRYALMQAHISNNQADEALEEGSQLLLKDPNDIQVYRLLSRAYYQTKQFDMSLLCAEKANEMLKEQRSRDRATGPGSGVLEVGQFGFQTFLV